MNNSDLSPAELAVAFMEDERLAKRERAQQLARDCFASLVVLVGDETAREAWKLAVSRRRRGYRVTDEKARGDRLVVLMDETNRDLGMAPEMSAERIMEQFDIGNDPHDTRRTLDRIKARLRKTSIQK